MLGYVRASVPELRMREYDCYRSLYCGLCRHMGKCTGQCSRMSLSYDFVFLALARISLTNEKLTHKRVRCLVHPFKKRMAVTDSPTLTYCADATAILTYHKCRDDVNDEKGLKKLRGRLASLWFRGGYRRAVKRHPALDKTVREHLKRLGQYETDETAYPSADIPAEIFGDVMSAIFSEGLSEQDARIASSLGKALGRWVYLADAADDFQKDKKEHAFNPYLALFGNEPTKEDWENVKLAMKQLLSDAERAFLLIDPHTDVELNELMCNILYIGLPNTADRILEQNAKGELQT